MKQLLTFLKATLLGGVIFVLPAWLAVLLVAKALTKLQVLVKPVSTHLPESVGHPRLLAVILLLALCFVIGLIIQTAIGAQVKRMVERRVLEKLPGYTTLRGFAAQLSEFEKTSNFQPALIEIEDALMPGFLVEQHTNDRCTVFVPSVHYADGRGPLYHRYQPCASIPAGIKVMQCTSKWGLR